MVNPVEELAKPFEEDNLAAARRWNHLGKVIYVVCYLLFNLVFWITAITEYMRPAEEYISKEEVI